MTTTAKGGKPYRSSFCGKRQDKVRKLIAGQGVYICDECITLCREIVDEEFMETPKARSLGAKVPSPRRINEILDQYVIGQDKAKRVLSVAVYNHYKRVGAGHRVDDVELGKSNVLLIGPTGCGKTLLAQTLARILDVPFSIADATSLTEAGYVGEDVENILLRLIQAADFLLKYVLIPEFVGRMPVIVPLQALDEADLLRILTEPKNAIVKQYQKFLSIDKVELQFTEDGLIAAASGAAKRKTGARGLRTIIEEVLLDVMYEIPSRADVRKVVVTAEAIEGKTNPLLLSKNEQLVLEGDEASSA